MLIETEERRQGGGRLDSFTETLVASRDDWDWAVGFSARIRVRRK